MPNRSNAKLKWEGSNDETCPHEHLEDIPKPTGFVIYPNPYERDGKTIEPPPYEIKKSVVRCKDCGGIAKI